MAASPSRPYGEILAEPTVSETIFRALLERGDWITARSLSRASRGLRAVGRRQTAVAERELGPVVERLLTALEVVIALSGGHLEAYGDAYSPASLYSQQALQMLREAAKAGLISVAERGTTRRGGEVATLVDFGEGGDFYDDLIFQEVPFRSVAIFGPNYRRLAPHIMGPGVYIQAERKGAPITVGDIVESAVAIVRECADFADVNAFVEDFELVSLHDGDIELRVLPETFP